MRMVLNGALRPCRGLCGLFTFFSFKHVVSSTGQVPVPTKIASRWEQGFIFLLLSLTSSCEERPALLWKQRSLFPAPSFPNYWEDLIPIRRRKSEEGALQAKEALKRLPIDLHPTRKQEGKLQTPTLTTTYTRARPAPQKQTRMPVAPRAPT